MCRSYCLSSLSSGFTDSRNLSRHRGLLCPCVRWLEGKPRPSAECGASCRYSPGGPFLKHCQRQTPQWWIPLLRSHSSSRGPGVPGAGPGAVRRPGAARGAPGKEPVDPSSLRSAWRGRAEVEVDDGGGEDGGRGTGGTGGTPARQRRSMSEGSVCCGRGGCLPPEEPRQTHSSSGPGCWSSTCRTDQIRSTINMFLPP